jgi:farnesyl-diphosphate farnesyltransferase
MASITDVLYQQSVLPRVSRTFALTIPQLPPALREVVGNAYLLCRLADTIEDDPCLSSDEKSRLMMEFLATLCSEGPPEDFGRRLQSRLSMTMSDAERQLATNIARVLRVTASFPDAQRRAVIRCVSVMGRGMPEFQRCKTLDGLATLEDLDRYCYFVAGVVGEMLTELFCEHSPGLYRHRGELMALAVRFGQGLQMTNILKDIWEDRECHTCWLPRSFFPGLKGGLGGAVSRGDGYTLTGGIHAMLAIARSHLAAGLRYAQLIPKSEPGIRRFCLWAIGMAVLTLRKIHRTPGYSTGGQVKISRRAVRATVLTCNLALYSNRLLRLLFATATRGLPRIETEEVFPPGADLASDRPA